MVSVKNFFINLSVEKIFVIIALFFGLMYSLILPPFQSVDETTHFFRAYQITEGHFLATQKDGQTGDYLPKAISTYYEKYIPLIKNVDKKVSLAELKDDLKISVNKKETKFVSFPNTALYSPVCYISHLPGIILGKLLTPKIAVQFYLGRLSNLFIYCLLVFFAIRIIPLYKLSLMVIALMPMSLSLAGAYSSDVIVYGLNFLWLAFIMKIITQKETLHIFKTFIILLLLAFLLSISKSYFLLIPLCFIIPINKFKTFKNYIIIMLSVLISAIIGLMLWSSFIKGISINMNPGIANPMEQISYIISHPVNYAIIIVKTFFIKLPRLIITMIGVLGWQDTKLDFITYILYPLIIYISAVLDNCDFEFLKWQKYIILMTVILGIIITFTSLYIMWSPVTNNIILGLNGKYFIPLILPALLLFKNCNCKYDINKIKPILIIMLILILFSSELSLLHRFYDITPQLYYKI